MIVAQSASMLDRQWWIDYAFGEFAAQRIDGVYAWYRTFGTFQEAIEWVTQ